MRVEVLMKASGTCVYTGLDNLKEISAFAFIK